MSEILYSNRKHSWTRQTSLYSFIHNLNPSILSAKLSTYSPSRLCLLGLIPT